MFRGTTVEELMAMVEQAEQHAMSLVEQQHALELEVLAYKTSDSEALAGVA